MIVDDAFVQGINKKRVKYLLFKMVATNKVIKWTYWGYNKDTKEVPNRCSLNIKQIHFGLDSQWVTVTAFVFIGITKHLKRILQGK